MSENSRITKIFELLSDNSIAERIKTCYEKGTTDHHKFFENVLFPEDLYPTPKEKDSNLLLHCLRCHVDYDPEYNYNESCKMNHPEDKIKRVYIQDHHELLRKTNLCEMCGPEDPSPDGNCFTGNHTSRPKDLEYTHLFPTCEEVGCDGINQTPSEEEKEDVPLTSTDSTIIAAMVEKMIEEVQLTKKMKFE
jgi:hypothetical protein